MNLASAHRTSPRRRDRLLAAGAAALVCACVCACGGGAGAGSQTNLPSGHSKLQSIIEDEALLRANPVATLTLFKSLGVDRVRTYVWWGGPYGLAPDSSDRHAPRGFDAADPADYPAAGWATYDAIVRAAAKVGIGLDVTVGSPPPLWAASSGAPKGSIYASSWKPSAKDFGAFMHAIGLRYSGHYRPPGARAPLPRVTFWSIWNEPNYGPYLAPQAIDDSTVEVAPELYRGLLDAAWRALAATGHTVTNGTILIGETAPRGVQEPANFNGTKPLRFIRALYCVGADFKPLRGLAATERGCPATAAGSASFAADNPALFDASGFADHPYPDEDAPTVVTPPPTGTDYADFAALSNLETTLARAAKAYGRDVKLPIWNTEFGYRTTPPGPYGLPLATAARYLNEAEYLSWRDPRIRSDDQYLLTDPPAGSGSDFVTGIEFADGTPKPDVFDAFRMPLWLPVTHVPKTGSLVVWGCVRPAPLAARRTRRPQRVRIEFSAGSAASYRTLRVVTLTAGGGCYFETRVRFPSSGTVRLAWSGSGQTLYSRSQALSA